MLDPQIFRCLALGFCLLFFPAAIHKLTYRARFSSVLSNYRILPAKLISTATILIPLLELILALSWLLAAFSLKTPAVMSIGSGLLLMVYALAITLNLLRGRRHIDCGCGFSLPDTDHHAAATGQQLSLWLVARNLLLAAAAVGSLAEISTRELTGIDHLLVIPVTLMLILFYAAFNQLVTNDGAMASWRHAHD